LNSTKSGSYTPDKSVVTPASPVADSGTPPADLAGLREWNASRNPSSIIADKITTLRERLADPSTPPAAIPGLEAAIRRVEKQRDPAAKVAQDKLNARLDCHIETHNDHITLNIERRDPIYFDSVNDAIMYAVKRDGKIYVDGDHLDARRAAQALAASRMAAKVAADKLEARVDQAARELLNHAHDQSGTLESALADFRDFDPSLLGEMGERVLNRAQDLDGEVAISTPRRRYRSCLNPYRRGDY
jgi:hypothetical protein